MARRVPSPAGPVRVALAVAALLVVAACTSGSADDAASSPTSTEATAAGATTPTTDAELASETYVAGYPLLVSTRTFQRLGGLVGENGLFWQSALSTPDTRVVVAPNRDTLYSIAVIDLRAGPLALTLPEIDDRYFTYQLLDAWTESFAYLGTRATDGRAGTWVITPPGWDGELPAGTEQIEAPTPQVFLLGRYLVDGEEDIPAVTARRDQVTLEPLTALTGEDPAPPPPLGTPAGTAQDIPTDAAFFTELSAAVAVDGPTTPAQRDLFARAAAAGIIGEDGGPPTADDALLDEGAAAGDRRIDEAAEARGADGGWSTPGGRVGTYGDDLLQRALVARVGWGANVPEEAVYSVARTDAEGEDLDGTATYRIRFPADALPPVDAFWSLTAYGPDLFLAPHPSGRHTLGDRTPGLTYAPDGSLEVVVAAAAPPPGADGAEPAWLPVPDGPFVLMLRLYLPQPDVIDGTWAPPPIVRDP